MTLAVDGNSKTHIDTRTHTQSSMRSPNIRNDFPNHFIKMQSVVVWLSVVCVYLTAARVGLWSMNVSFPGHAHLFDQTVNTYDISNTPCSHVYLKE